MFSSKFLAECYTVGGIPLFAHSLIPDLLSPCILHLPCRLIKPYLSILPIDLLWSLLCFIFPAPLFYCLSFLKAVILIYCRGSVSYYLYCEVGDDLTKYPKYMVCVRPVALLASCLLDMDLNTER